MNEIKKKKGVIFCRVADILPCQYTDNQIFGLSSYICVFCMMGTRVLFVSPATKLICFTSIVFIKANFWYTKMGKQSG